MSPDPSLQPMANEAPLSLEFALIVLGIGALIFLYIVVKLVRERRQT